MPATSVTVPDATAVYDEAAGVYRKVRWRSNLVARGAFWLAKSRTWS